MILVKRKVLWTHQQPTYTFLQHSVNVSSTEVFWLISDLPSIEKLIVSTRTIFCCRFLTIVVSSVTTVISITTSISVFKQKRTLSSVLMIFQVNTMGKKCLPQQLLAHKGISYNIMHFFIGWYSSLHSMAWQASFPKFPGYSWKNDVMWIVNYIFMIICLPLTLVAL